MAAGFTLGVDFGTSNTVAMVRTGDADVRQVLFDGSPLLPSGVFVLDEEMLTGRDAQQRATA